MNEKYKDLYPGKTVEEILPIIYFEHVKIVKDSYLKIMSNIQSKALEVVDSLNNKSMEINNYIKSVIQDPCLDSYESRKNIINYLKGLKNIFNEESLSEILKIADNMPYPQNDTSAFIIKYQDRFNTIQNKNSIRYELDKSLTTKERKIFEKIKANYQSEPQTTFEKFKHIFKETFNIPNETLQHKVDREYSKTLENFAKKQDEVLNAINNYLQKTIKAFKNDINGIITNSQSNHTDQKIAVSRIRSLKTPFNETVYESIIEPILNLPTAKTDVSAFVVKYAQKETPITATITTKRSDKEICQALLRDSLVSVEHIEPQSDLKEKNASRKYIDNIKNLAIAHKHCNEQRGSQHLYSYVQEHPEIKVQAQKQMDYIIECLNKDLITCYEYPGQIKQTLYEQSGGLLDLDISKLKVKNKVAA